ncbi:MAG: preprotein translocase subunit SecG [Paludibacteraceae bacterium]|jgi:protein translocase, SecG subunit|nr:preprotein translocase subunit SecG [Paludibacteraceae bacterium]
MFTFITIVVVIASITLVFAVLMQNSKGGGLVSSFQAQNQIMGVKKTTDFMEKATWFLMCVVVVLSIASAAFYPREEAGAKSKLTGQVEATTTPSSDAEAE